jgi:Zn-dependent protease
MIRIPGRVPIVIFPAFWIFSFLIGFLLSNGNLIQMVPWVGVIFVSVLFHEFGHALTASVFGRRCHIELVAMGGLTYHDGLPLPFWKQLLVIFNGPFFGFLLGLGAYFLEGLPQVTSLPLKGFLSHVKNINWFWTAVNLLPILPLDGGQLLRVVLEKVFHAKGVRYALFFSMLLALGISLFLFLMQQFLAGAILFLFAFESFDGFRKTKHLKDSDRNTTFKDELLQAEMQLQGGHKKEALEAFEKLRREAKEGIIYVIASQYAAFLNYELGTKKEAYEILKSLKERLDAQGLCLLHKVAFEESDFSLVNELAGVVFQSTQDVEVALRNAEVAAHLIQAEAAIGWLETALGLGVVDLKEVIQSKSFDPIRSDPAFHLFVSHLSK